jgi:UDP-N-acetylglucosamine--N-acetylmuramyl-(pentapeptide) pyrophosphoryl-undecaprenol N-acetylglucosamine transferase
MTAGRVTVMAGGTGGHVFPALATAQELARRGWEVSWLGVPDSFESRLVPAYGFPLDLVPVRKMRGQGLGAWLLAPLHLATALVHAGRALRRRRPGVVLGMGGFVSGPGGLVSRLLGYPLVIHEQNAIPGLTNRWLAHLATRVLEAFPGSFAATRSAVAVGNPVRREIVAVPAPEVRLAGRAGPARLLVVGGSLGAQVLNETLPPALAGLPEAARPLVRHQAGRGKAEAAEQAYRAAGVAATVSEFVDDMAEAYAWADLLVCRAGALTVSELAAAGVPAVLVPYPHAVDDHQTRNAAYLADAGAALLLPQPSLTAQRLAELLATLGGDRARLLGMAQAARRLARPDAAQRVADACEEASHR